MDKSEITPSEIEDSNTEPQIKPKVLSTIDDILEENETYSDRYLDIIDEAFETTFEGFPKNFKIGEYSIPGKGNVQFHEKGGSLYIETIYAIGHGKEVLFYIIGCAVNKNIKSIELKAEPIGDIKTRKSIENLVGFYGSFGFQKTVNAKNGIMMRLNLTEENLKFLCKKLQDFVTNTNK